MLHTRSTAVQRSRRRRLIPALALSIALAGCGVAEDEVRDRIARSFTWSPAASSALPVTWSAGDAIVEDVQAFYQGRDMRPAWTSGQGLNGPGRRVIAALETAQRHGLAPERYGIDPILALRDSLGSAQSVGEKADGLRDLDLRITRQYHRLLTDLVSGTADHFRSATHDSGRAQRERVLDALAATATGVRPESVIHSLRPAGRQYALLVRALERYTAIVERGGWPAVDARSDSASLARSLRARLLAEDDPREAGPASHGGDRPERFDEDLRVALGRFHERHGLDPTRELDDVTLAALNAPAEARVATLMLNLDRWRNISHDSHALHVLANVPAFEVFVIEHDRPLMRMRAVTGAKNHPTPVLIDTMKYIVTNPYWNVPASIVSEEILPALARDPRYLDRRNMELLDPAAENARIDASAIDWTGVDPDSFPFAIRQRPGPGNALGKVKFMFPNQQAIYLHDTPEVALFSNADRARSHGCIRVERPLEFARLVLERSSDRGAAVLDARLARPSEQWIELDRGVPVFVLYFTAWAEDDGSVRFLPDVYGRDVDSDFSDPGTPPRERAAGNDHTRP